MAATKANAKKKPALVAYHGDPKIKAKYLRRMTAHRKADQLIQGYGYWADGKGCAVGCCVHQNSNPHASYETELGIPEGLARLEETIFESLPKNDAIKWPERFLKAIRPGANLTVAWHQFAHWLLAESGLLKITDGNRAAIEAVAELHRRAAGAEKIADEQWSAARSAAESAARSAAESAAEWAAWSAAESAAWSAAWSAAESAAESAAWSAAESAAESAARCAAWSAAEWAARCAAWSAAEWAAWSASWQKIANKVIEILEAA